MTARPCDVSGRVMGRMKAQGIMLFLAVASGLTASAIACDLSPNVGPESCEEGEYWYAPDVLGVVHECKPCGPGDEALYDECGCDAVGNDEAGDEADGACDDQTGDEFCLVGFAFEQEWGAIAGHLGACSGSGVTVEFTVAEPDVVEYACRIDGIPTTCALADGYDTNLVDNPNYGAWDGDPNISWVSSSPSLRSLIVGYAFNDYKITYATSAWAQVGDSALDPSVPTPSGYGSSFAVESGQIYCDALDEHCIIGCDDDSDCSSLSSAAQDATAICEGNPVLAGYLGSCLLVNPTDYDEPAVSGGDPCPPGEAAINGLCVEPIPAESDQGDIGE